MANYKANKSALVKLADHTAATTESTLVLTPASPVDFTKYSSLLLEYYVEPTAAFILRLQYNSVSASYYTRGQQDIHQAPTYILNDNTTHWVIATATLLTAGTVGVNGKVEINTAKDGSALKLSIYGHARDSALVSVEQFAGTNTTTFTTLTSVTVSPSTSTWKAGSRFTLYGVQRT